MPTLKTIIGLEVPSLLVNDKGRQYLNDADNPGSMYFLDGYLFVKSDNTTFQTKEVAIIADTVYDLKQKKNGDKS
jgi:hypothetical protein